MIFSNKKIVIKSVKAGVLYVSMYNVFLFLYSYKKKNLSEAGKY